MGYDVWCHEPLLLKPEVTIEQLRDRLIAMQYPDGQLADPSFWGSPSYWVSSNGRQKPEKPEDYTTDDMVEMIFGGYWCLQKDDQNRLFFQPNEDHIRDTDEALEIFGQIQDLLLPRQTLDFKGEDDFKWRWEVSEDGKLRELDSETFYGQHINAPPAIEEILKILWPNDQEIEWTGQTALEIAESLRQHGFGPYAGKQALEAIAEADE